MACEPSTGTPYSFQLAIQRVQRKVLPFTDTKRFSVVKRERLWDTISLIKLHFDFVSSQEDHWICPFQYFITLTEYDVQLNYIQNRVDVLGSKIMELANEFLCYCYPPSIIEEQVKKVQELLPNTNADQFCVQISVLAQASLIIWV